MKLETETETDDVEKVLTQFVAERLSHLSTALQLIAAELEATEDLLNEYRK